MTEYDVEILKEELNQLELDLGRNKFEIQRLFKLQKKLHRRKTQILYQIVKKEKAN